MKMSAEDQSKDGQLTRSDDDFRLDLISTSKKYVYYFRVFYRIPSH